MLVVENGQIGKIVFWNERGGTVDKMLCDTDGAADQMCRRLDKTIEDRDDTDKEVVSSMVA